MLNPELALSWWQASASQGLAKSCGMPFEDHRSEESAIKLCSHISGIIVCSRLTSETLLHPYPSLLSPMFKNGGGFKKIVIRGNIADKLQHGHSGLQRGAVPWDTKPWDLIATGKGESLIFPTREKAHPDLYLASPVLHSGKEKTGFAGLLLSFLEIPSIPSNLLEWIKTWLQLLIHLFGLFSPYCPQDVFLV